MLKSNCGGNRKIPISQKFQRFPFKKFSCVGNKLFHVRLFQKYTFWLEILHFPPFSHFQLSLPLFCFRQEKKKKVFLLNRGGKEKIRESERGPLFEFSLSISSSASSFAANCLSGAGFAISDAKIPSYTFGKEAIKLEIFLKFSCFFLVNFEPKKRLPPSHFCPVGTLHREREKKETKFTAPCSSSSSFPVKSSLETRKTEKKEQKRDKGRRARHSSF